jgi:nicotinate-nucleotide--dimethylbenzimidazole phosphoribosyltransferase
MTQDECDGALERGMELARETDADLCGVGDMGIGNTTSASALVALLLNRDGSETVGMGTGAVGEMLARKRRVVDAALQHHRPAWDGSARDALARVGGFETAGMTGFMLGCAAQRIPVVVDGFVATAAALCAVRTVSALRDYLFFGHESEERFHSAVLQDLNAEPILRLRMRLGEGTGAVLAMQVMEQALACYHEMATFEGAGVSNREP